MASEAEKKKYWSDQIKTMTGPCLITFALPMMIPGVTITFVAFGNEESFPKYGPLHIVGILILGIATIFLFLGCFLRLYWKPFITPDIEMFLSPTGSARSLQTDRHNSRVIRSGEYNDTLPRDERRFKETALPTRRNSFDSSKLKKDNIAENKTEINKSESETEGTGSESERKALTGNTSNRKFDILASPRCRNMVPVHSESFEESEANNDSCSETYNGGESYEALQEFRRKKRKGRKRSKSREKKNISEFRVSEENEIDTDRQVEQREDKFDTPVKRMKKKEKLSAENSVNTGACIEHNLDFDVNREGSTEATQSVKGKGKKRKKKKKILESDKLRNPTDIPPDQNRHIFEIQNEALDSDQSFVSLGSTDSVLAQYTSRSNRKKDVI